MSDSTDWNLLFQGVLISASILWGFWGCSSRACRAESQRSSLLEAIFLVFVLVLVLDLGHVAHYFA
jgi:hypothetical protein